MSFRHFAAAEPKRPPGGLSGQGETKKPRPSPPAKDIFTACREGDIETVRKHLAAGTDLNKFEEEKEETALFYMACTAAEEEAEEPRQQFTELFQFMLSQPGVDVNKGALLAKLAFRGSRCATDIMENVPSRDWPRCNASIGLRYFDLATMLLNEPGIDPNTDYYGYTALYFAVYNERFLRRLLADERVDPNIQTSGPFIRINSMQPLWSMMQDKLTPLMYAIKRHDVKLRIIKLLLRDDRVDPNIPDVFGQTPLMYAVRTKHKAVKLLLANKRVNLHQTMTVTALDIANMKTELHKYDHIMLGSDVENNTYSQSLVQKIKREILKQRKMQKRKLARVMHRKQIEEGKGHFRKAPTDVLKHIGSFLDHEMKSKLHF